MTFVFEPATKEAVKARLVLEGPGGSGKTCTALRIASALADGGRIAVIDTQARQSLYYADQFKFDVTHLSSFHPDSLVDALACASGYDVTIVDTASRFWSGREGMLEQVDRLSDGRSGSTFNNGWKEMRPVEMRMIEAMMCHPTHLIVTLRVKTEYVINVDPSTGKHNPRKVGLKPDQREGLDYEFSIVGTLDMAHTMTVTKANFGLFDGAIIEKAGEEFGLEWLQWLNNGERIKTAWEFRDEALSPGQTFETLRELRDVIVAAGRANTPLLDENGDPSTLIEIITRRGRELAPQKGK